jgi:hypothetical protein
VICDVGRGGTRNIILIKGGNGMNRLVVQRLKGINSIIAWLLPLIFVMSLSSGCAFKVKLVGEYDEILDKSVTEIQEQTATFFSKMKSASSSDLLYEPNKAFYDGVQGKISTLIRRSEVIEEGLKFNPLTKNFKELQSQYQDLAEQHKKSFSPKYLESAEKAFDQSFRAILENILYLKWNKTQPQK